MTNSERPKPGAYGPCLNAHVLARREWEALTSDDIELFNRKVVCRQYKAGSVVFGQGDPCKGLYLVERGLVAVRKIDGTGQSAIVRLAPQGHSLGYRPLLAKEHHRATAEVINDAQICFVDAPTMHRLLLNNPKLGARFLELTAQTLGGAEARLFQVAALSVRTRIVHILILLREHYGRTTNDGSIFLELPMSRRDLADMIGARPESVSRNMRELMNDGLISLSGRTVRIGRLELLVEELHRNP